MKRLLLPLLFAAGTAFAADPVPEALRRQMADIDAEAAAGDLAPLERLQARQSLEALATARTRERADAEILATLALDTADVAVKSAQLRMQLQQLERERDAILLQASRRDAELARKDAERLRLQALAREEEQAMAAEAAPAADAGSLDDVRAKDAELARIEEELAAQAAAKGDVLHSRRIGGKPAYVLSATAFQPGKAVLDAGARQDLQLLAKRLKSGGAAWSIQGHTDTLGSEPSNLELSKKRAQAVLAVLTSAGVAAGKLSATGLGSTKPVASNAGRAGRAQNRRIEIIQK